MNHDVNAGTAVFVLNIGDKAEVWSSPLASPKGGAYAGYASQGPLAVSASSVYGMSQPMAMFMPMSMPMQQGYMQAQQVNHTTPFSNAWIYTALK